MSKPSPPHRPRSVVPRSPSQPSRIQVGQKSTGSSSLYAIHVLPYLEFVRHHRGRRTTHQLENALGRFCSWLDHSGGVTEFHRLTAAHVRDFIASLQDFRPATVAVHGSALRGFFAYLRLEGVLERDLAWAIELPRLYSLSQPPQVLAEETVERLLAAVDRSSPMGKRDLAMLLLAARYGLRSSDIRGLRFDYIHWREQRIVLVQSKTQRPLELPLLAEVDHALASYIRDGRPPCPDREIFVRHLAPITRLGQRNNLWPVMVRAQRAAGIEGPIRGFHLLRHSAATRMLRRGVDLDTISDILGHSSVDATRRYAQVDLAGLKSVALSEAEVRR
jgi:site-specific recombinase XerD